MKHKKLFILCCIAVTSMSYTCEKEVTYNEAELSPARVKSLPRINDYFSYGHVSYQSQELDQLFWRYKPEKGCIEFKKVVGHPALIKKLQKVSSKGKKEDLHELVELAKASYVKARDDKVYIARLKELPHMNIRIVEEIAQLDNLGFVNTKHSEKYQAVVVPNSAFGCFKKLYTYPPNDNPMDAKRFCTLIEEMMKQEPDYNRGTFLIALYDKMSQFYEEVQAVCDGEETGWQRVKQRSKDNNKQHKKRTSKGKEKG